MIKTNRRNRSNTVAGLQKERTGIPGFDEITGGGLPAGRPTLICGSAGAGKTLFAMEFLVRGAMLYNQPASSYHSKRQPKNSPPTSLRSGSTCTISSMRRN